MYISLSRSEPIHGRGLHIEKIISLCDPRVNMIVNAISKSMYRLQQFLITEAFEHDFLPLWVHEVLVFHLLVQHATLSASLVCDLFARTDSVISADIDVDYLVRY